jgi:hypothetical protein
VVALELDATELLDDAAAELLELAFLESLSFLVLLATLLDLVALLELSLLELLPLAPQPASKPVRSKAIIVFFISIAPFTYNFALFRGGCKPFTQI